MKRTLSILISLVLVFSMVPCAYAVDSTSNNLNADIESLVASYLRNYNDPSLFESTYAVGQELPAYVFKDGDFEEFRTARYFPIFKDNEIWAMVTMVNADTNDPSYTIDRDFPKELKAATNNGANNGCLILDFLTVYSYSGSDLSELMTYDLTLEGDESTSRPQKTKARTIKDFIQDSGINFKQVKANDLSPLNISVPVATRSVEPPIRHTLDVTLYKQPQGSEICWAVATYCIARELLWPTAPTPYPYPRDPMEIVNYRNANFPDPDRPTRQSGKIEEAQRCLKEMYHIYTNYYTRPLTVDEMEESLDDFCPMYSAWYNAGWTYGHSVCVAGYNLDEDYTTTVIIMESLTGYYKEIVRNGAGEYHMMAASIPVQWQQSLMVYAYP